MSANASGDPGSNIRTTTVTLCQTVPSKVIVNVGNQDGLINKVTSGKTVTVVPMPSNSPAVLSLAPGITTSTTASSVPILSQDSVSALLQSYINTQLLQASRSQHPGVTRGVMSPPVTATLARHSSNSTVTTPARVLANQVLNFNVKIFNPLKKKDFDTCVLRKVLKDAISTPMLLRKELLRQFGENLISTDSDCTVGYIKGGCKLTICSSADVDEVWKSGLKGENVTLWCYAPRHKNASDDSDSDEDVTKPSHQKKRRKLTVLEEKNKRVESTISSLREKHGNRFTTIQYRLWGEMIDVGTHKYIYY